MEHLKNYVVDVGSKRKGSQDFEMRKLDSEKLKKIFKNESS